MLFQILAIERSPRTAREPPSHPSVAADGPTADRGRREANHTSRTNRAVNPDGPSSTVKACAVTALISRYAECRASSTGSPRTVTRILPLFMIASASRTRNRSREKRRRACRRIDRSRSSGGPEPESRVLRPDRRIFRRSVRSEKRASTEAAHKEGKSAARTSTRRSAVWGRRRNPRRVRSRPGAGRRTPAGAPPRALSGGPPRRRTARGPRLPFRRRCRTGGRRRPGRGPSAARRSPG